LPRFTILRSFGCDLRKVVSWIDSTNGQKMQLQEVLVHNFFSKKGDEDGGIKRALQVFQLTQSLKPEAEVDDTGISRTQKPRDRTSCFDWLCRGTVLVLLAFDTKHYPPSYSTSSSVKEVSYIVL
jgi:hypothetical protein